jgi:hypothetical protein
MTTKRLKEGEEKLPGGPLARHGGYSVAMKDQLLRRRPEILRYLKRTQRDIVRDICPEGEEDLTAARRILIDRIMSKLATVRLIETYLGEHGILRRDKLEGARILEGEPIFQVWLSLNNQIREDLKLIGFDRKALEAEVLTPAELLEAAAEDAGAQENRAESVQDGRSAEGEGYGRRGRGPGRPG